MEKEVLKQFAGSLVRYLLAALFGVLVSKRILPQGLVEAIGESTILLVTTFVIGAIPLVWSWFKTRFSVYMARYARSADPGTSMAQIKKEVLAEKTVVSV